ITALAERLDAPVVTTINARGLMHRHALAVPASPSLKAVRALVEGSDLAIAIGTEFGPTDYDMYGDGGFAPPATLIRIDIDGEQLDRLPAKVRIEADSRVGTDALIEAISTRSLRGTSDG